VGEKGGGEGIVVVKGTDKRIPSLLMNIICLGIGLHNIVGEVFFSTYMKKVRTYTG